MQSPVVAVALSGGVDSLVSGYLLKQQYPHIFGVHFTTGYEAAPIDLKKLEDQLGFTVHELDLSRLFEAEVVRYFISTYMEGKTPNPCLFCNQKIKFGTLLEEVTRMGAGLLATGHYAHVHNAASCPDMDSQDQPWLEKGTDPRKDQSYFLARLTATQLNRILFPLAGMTKDRVKALAREKGLKPLGPGESQDICFIPDGAFADFILKKQNATPQPGPIKDLEGKVVGQHRGLHAFTIGQRRGINCPASEPYYVRAIDMASNTLVVCFKKDLGQAQMQLRDLIWHLPAPVGDLTLETKIRYNHPGARANVTVQGTRASVSFEDPQFALTPGQAAVFYRDNRVVGSGIIE